MPCIRLPIMIYYKRSVISLYSPQGTHISRWLRQKKNNCNSIFIQALFDFFTRPTKVQSLKYYIFCLISITKLDKRALINMYIDSLTFNQYMHREPAMHQALVMHQAPTMCGSRQSVLEPREGKTVRGGKSTFSLFLVILLIIKGLNFSYSFLIFMFDSLVTKSN